MADYSIVIIKPCLMLVNGEVCRQNDYDYEDPDFARQQAMDHCQDMANGCDRLSSGRAGEKAVPLCEVAPLLDASRAWMLFADRQTGRRPPLGAEALLEISIHLGQNILKLSRPGECL